MRLIHTIRFSIGTIMMFVLMAATAMALFVKIFFSFLTILLVTAGGLLQAGVYAVTSAYAVVGSPSPPSLAPIPMPAKQPKPNYAPAAASPDLE